MAKDSQPLSVANYDVPVGKQQSDVYATVPRAMQRVQVKGIDERNPSSQVDGVMLHGHDVSESHLDGKKKTLAWENYEMVNMQARAQDESTDDGGYTPVRHAWIAGAPPRTEALLAASKPAWGDYAELPQRRDHAAPLDHEDVHLELHEPRFSDPRIKPLNATTSLSSAVTVQTAPAPPGKRSNRVAPVSDDGPVRQTWPAPVVDHSEQPHIHQHQFRGAAARSFFLSSSSFFFAWGEGKNEKK